MATGPTLPLEIIHDIVAASLPFVPAFHPNPLSHHFRNRAKILLLLCQVNSSVAHVAQRLLFARPFINGTAKLNQFYRILIENTKFRHWVRSLNLYQGHRVYPEDVSPILRYIVQNCYELEILALYRFKEIDFSSLTGGKSECQILFQHYGASS